MSSANGHGPVLVVDDDQALRELVAATLEDAGFRTTQAGGGSEALEAIKRERPGLVLLDVVMPGLSGYEVCRALRDRFGSSLPLLFLSGARVESYDRVAGLMLGADDYLVKPFAPDELLARVRALLRRSASNGGATPALTRRESEILRLLAEGYGQPEIARRLVISSKTVGTHVGNILGKLGVKTRAQAVARAYRDGLVESSV